MRDVKIKINDDGYASSYEKFIGIQNENEATRLVFDLPDIYKKDGSYQYVAFTLPDGTIKVRRLVDYACIIDSEITSQRGVILISVIIKSVENVLDIETGFIMSSQPISGYIKKTILEETGTNSIDKNVRIYLDEFDALLMEIRKTDARLASLLDSDPSKYAEIIDARGGYTVLKNRLDAMLSSINTNYNNIKSNSREIEVNHNDIVSNYSTLLTKINALASGSPKGTYETATLLKADNPDTGVYIATGNGHIYSWTKNQSGDPVDLGVYQAAEDSDTVSKLKVDLSYLRDGLETFSLYSSARVGRFVNGEYRNDNLKRVALVDLMIFDRNIDITVENGYRADILKYTSEGVYLTDLKYVTDTYTLEKNTPIKVVIRVVDETSASDYPDIAEFISKVTFKTKIENKINELNNKVELNKSSLNNTNKGIDTLFNYCNLVLGTVDGGVVSYRNNRVTSNDIVNLGREVEIIIKDGYRFGMSVMNENGTYKEWSGWKTGTYTIPENTYFKPLIAKVNEDSNPVNIIEMNNTVTFNTIIKKEILSLSSLLKTYKDEVDMLPGGFGYPGTGTIYTGNYPTNRFVTRQIQKAPFDLVLGFKEPSETISYQLAFYNSASDEVAINKDDIFKNYHFEKCFIPKDSFFRITYSLGSEQTSEQYNDCYENLIIEKYEKDNIAPVYNTLLPSKPRIAMHKGYSSIAPENSEAAFILAGQESSVYAIECDTRITSDGKFVIYHDDDLANQTTGSGSVSSHTFNEVTSYVFNKNVNGLTEYPNEHVCSLETYLKTCKKYGKIALCELKFTESDRNDISNFKNFVDMLYKTGMQHSTIVISFESSELAKIHQIDNSIYVLKIMMSADKFDYKTCGLIHNYGIDVNYESSSAGSGLTEQQIIDAHKLGLIVGVWTPDDNTIKNNYIDYGVDLITTNNL